MEIAIDQLSLRLSGGSALSQTRARAIADLAGAALADSLRAHAPELAVAPAGYTIPSLAVPTVHVGAGATNDAIAQTIANALARAILRELDID